MPGFAMRRPRTLVLAGIVAITAAIVGAQAPSLKPTPLDQVTAQVVATLVEHDHLEQPKIDDEVSKKWAVNFLKALDPLKYNFVKADVDEFLADSTKLDDKVKHGDLGWARKVFERFLTRSDERLADVQEILKTKPDFTIEESMVDDPDRLEWPADAPEARDRLRKLLKFDWLQKKVSKVEDAEIVKQLLIRYKDINRIYRQFDTSELLEKYLSAMTMAIDPHSSYMGSKTLEDMVNQQLHLSLEGIGASLQSIDGYPTVIDVVPGGAADKDGRLQVDDKIVGIEDDAGHREDFVEKKLTDVVRKIRGPAGTRIKIVIQPGDSKELKVYELTRQKIELTEQHAKSKVIEQKVEGREQPLKIGVIHLPAFYGDTAAVLKGEADAVSATRDCRKMLEEFKKQGVDVVVLDLRMNGGGLLQEAITLSGLFIDKGPVVQVRDGRGTRHLDDEDEGTAWDGPLAVVIDRFSASASEIFAGVIKDYRRGLILGDVSTYGKGTVQQIMPLNERLRLAEAGKGGEPIPNLGALKLTIQQFYRPDGDSTQIRGVKPDIHIPSYNDYSDLGEGKSDSALKFDRVKPLPHDMYNRVPSDLVNRLEDRSLARRKESPKFQEETAFLKRVEDRKKRHEISLNEAKFRAESKTDEDDPDVKPKNRKKKGHNRQVAWDSNYYNDEILAIVGDYVTLGSRVVASAPVPAAAARPEPPALVP